MVYNYQICQLLMAIMDLIIDHFLNYGKGRTP